MSTGGELNMKTETGVMVMKDGKAWGVVYNDGHSTSFGWIAAEDAPIHDPIYCILPTDVTYRNSPDIEELRTGKIVKVTRVTTVNIEEN